MVLFAHTGGGVFTSKRSSNLLEMIDPGKTQQDNSPTNNYTGEGMHTSYIAEGIHWIE